MSTSETKYPGFTRIEDFECLAGKTIAQIDVDCSDLAIRFTDDTYFMARASCDGCGPDDCDFHFMEPDDDHASAIGLISYEEAVRRRKERIAQAAERTREERRQTYERLKAEFEPGGLTPPG